MPTNHFKNANALALNGQLEEAVKAYRMAIQENPNFYISSENLGNTLVKMGDIEAAIIAYRAAISVKPTAVWSLYNLGKLLTEQGSFEEAVVYLQKSIAIKPESFYYNCLGLALAKLERVNEAEEALQKAVDLDPDCFDAYLHLAQLKQGQKLWSEALGFYRQAVSMCPSSDAYFGMGKVLRELGQWEDAVVEYQKARDISPNFLEIHLHLGEVLQKLGRVAEAESCYRRCLQIEPQQVEARTKLEALSSHQVQVATKSKEEKKTEVSLAIGIEDDSIQLKTLQAKTKNLQAKYEHLQSQHDLIQKELASVSKNYRSMRRMVDHLNSEKEQLERQIKKQASYLNSQNTMLSSSVSNILHWRYGSLTPGIKDWEKKWDNSAGKRILYFTPIDYSGSFYKWATAVNQYTEYAVRLITLQFHEFGYLQDLVVPISHQCEISIRTIISEADAIHREEDKKLPRYSKKLHQIFLQGNLNWKHHHNRKKYSQSETYPSAS
jgi:tetratricopeptide (TPR) repeat protein